MAEGKRFKRLTAQRKYQIYLETRPADAPVGEILRRHGLTLEDLRQIEQTVQEASVEALKVRAGHWKKADVTPEQYETLRRRHEALRRAHSDLAVELELVKKKDEMLREEESGQNSGKNT